MVTSGYGSIKDKEHMQMCIMLLSHGLGKACTGDWHLMVSNITVLAKRLLCAVYHLAIGVKVVINAAPQPLFQSIIAPFA